MIFYVRPRSNMSALNNHMSVTQMVEWVLPSEEETSMAAVRMVTQTRRPEQKLVHIFRATLDLSRIPRCELEWSPEVRSFMRKKEEVAAMSDVTWMEIVMIQSWQNRMACLLCPFMSRFHLNIRCWSLVSGNAPVTWLRCYIHQSVFSKISPFTLNIGW